MTNVFLFGIRGKMGKMVASQLENQSDLKLVGGFDLVENLQDNIFNSVENINIPYDVIIDFSRPESLDNIIELTKKNPKPVVLATTGYDENQLKQIDELAKSVPVFKSANMSIGVNLITDLVERAAKILFESSDIEIIEKHHNQKVDAPSGTAMHLANAINTAIDKKGHFVYGREGKSCRREKGDIAIHTVRGGTVVGEHEVGFYCDDEVITVSHSALSRRIFAQGALKAAAFLIGKNAGLYSMKNLLN